MSNLPAKYQSATPATFEEVEKLAHAFAASGFFQDARDAAQAMVKIQAGRELGVPAIASMTSINVIKGRITMSAQLMAGLLQRAGYRLVTTWQGNEACTVEVSDSQGVLGSASFSLEDARRAGLSGQNWSKYPRNMLYARAVSNAARWYAPGVLLGVYTPEELEDSQPRHRTKRPSVDVEKKRKAVERLEKIHAETTRPG